LNEEEKERARERARKYYERHKDKKHEYYLKNRDRILKQQIYYKLETNQQLGTTNFDKNTDLDNELKRLGLYKYKKLWHASNKKELKRARSKLGLNENKHDSQNDKNEFP
jgi:hypothetical protein